MPADDALQLLVAERDLVQIVPAGGDGVLGSLSAANEADAPLVTIH